jgi:dTDP-glucose 4,6-dehydratase
VRTILATGVAGFIGSNFVYYYLKKYHKREIIGIDKLTYAGNFDNFSALSRNERSRFTFEKGDISDQDLVDSIFKKYEIDGVVNFAAETHVDRSIHDPLAFLKTNIVGTGILLEAARASWYRDGSWQKGKKFLQVSTDEVYGSLRAIGSFSEKTPLDPHSPYSASKAAADLLVKAYHDTYGMPVVITRCSNNYGPYQFPEKLIPLVIKNALNHQPLPIYGDGKQVRDWLFVEDHCRALDIVLEKGRFRGVYNIGGNNEWENIRLVKMVISELNSQTGDSRINENLIRFVKDRPGHDRRYAIDSSKIQRELHWAPRTEFPEGLRKTVSWYLEHQQWLKDVISGEYLRFYENNYVKR